MTFNDTFIDRVNSHKHLGVFLTSNLDWSLQIHQSCLKANRKLSVLRSVKMLQRKTLDLLFKVTVRSVVDYALPLYGNTLRNSELARLEQLQYRGAKIVTGALHFTSREKLNEDLGWETIKKRIDFLGLCIFHKIHRYECRPLLRKCLTKLDIEKRQTRFKGGYGHYPNYGHKFLNSFFPYISKLWNSLPVSTRILEVADFKCQLKLDMKPAKYKTFSVGYKYSNSILTRFRTGRTDLNLDRFTIGLSTDPSCQCHHKVESSEHFILDCFLFTVERQKLFEQVEHLIPNFSKFNKKEKFHILTRGVEALNPDFYYTNKKLSLAVQNFIIKTKRFS